MALAASHYVRPGFRRACERPEQGNGGPKLWYSSKCRGCLTAIVAVAINDPERIGRNYSTRQLEPFPDAALRKVRERLDEFDPLRVRAEQALLPLVGAS